ncbi:hypothetical protein AKO1_008548 [Acrasis kona]|uniref:Protein RER1 n=1 Tax=Acrasis kona TaxID=1008807 RepID=A0AAW2YN81_9EUKA
MYDIERESQNKIAKAYQRFSMRYQAFLDRINGQKALRWSVLAVLYLLYFVRVFYYQGWYIVTYGLGIYILNLLIAFLSPKIDPELENDDDENFDPVLPTGGTPKKSKDDEFRPFVRRLPEFKFWYSLAKAIVVSLFLSSTRLFDIPVFWPILLGYFIILFAITMRKQISHMIKHKYLPWSSGKKKYDFKQAGASQANVSPNNAYYNAPQQQSVGITTSFSAPKPGAGLGAFQTQPMQPQSTLTMYMPQTK